MHARRGDLNRQRRVSCANWLGRTLEAAVVTHATDRDQEMEA